MNDRPERVDSVSPGLRYRHTKTLGPHLEVQAAANGRFSIAIASVYWRVKIAPFVR
jgi:hypothetical protein